MASSIVKDITAYLEAESVAILGVEFKKLSHVVDVTKNSYKSSNKRYAARPLGLSESAGVVSHYTVDQDFEIILTNGYKTNKQTNDLDQQTKGIALQDYAHDIYKQLQQTSLASIRLISSLSLDEPEYDVDNKVVIQRMQITVNYKTRTK